MTENLNKTTWTATITDFIDELDESHLQEYFKQVRLAVCYQTHLLTAKISDDDSQDKQKKKDFDKAIQKITKTISSPITQQAKALPELQKIYQEFTQKGYLSDISTQIQVIEQENNFYKLWIYHLLLVADGVSIGTHIAKLTHSSSSASSLVDEINETQNGVLSTSTLKNPIYDGTYLSGAAMSKYAKFYLLNIGNQPLGLLLKQGDFSPLSELFSDDELERIKQDFHRLLNPDLQADSLAKQVYFPLDIYYPEYHQLVILQSSSLAQEIHGRFFEKKVRAEREKIEKYKNDGKYHSEILASPPKTLLFANVASQPQNVSVFLGSRGSGTRLFDGSAPIWQRQNNPPIHHKSLFSDGLLNARAKDNIAGLQAMLITFETANISFKDPKRLKGVLNWLNAVIDDVLDYVGEMAQFKAGWSNTDECKLPISHQVLLDFNRNDDKFVIAKNGDWQAVVVNDFVVWLNQKLYDKEKAFSVNDEHGRIWRDEFADKLREYVELLEISSTQKGEK